MSTDWCMEEQCRHRHWRSGSMPTHRRGDDCPPESGPVTGMEHAIEQAARAEANRRHAAAERSLNKSKYGEGSDYHANDGARDGFVDGAEWAVEHLRAAGVLAPAPLREEWAARYVNGGGAICPTRDEAEAALERMTRDSHRHRVDEPPAPEIAGIYARYVSEWLHVDRIIEGDGSADQ